MEWIIYGFMGFLGLIVVLVIGIGLYRANFGTGKDEANQGPKLGNSVHDIANQQSHTTRD